MNAAALVERCRSAGVELIADGDHLRVRGRDRVAFLPELREHKPALLEHLRRLAAGEAEPSSDPDPIAAGPAEWCNWSREPEPAPVEPWPDTPEHDAWWPPAHPSDDAAFTAMHRDLSMVVQDLVAEGVKRGRVRRMFGLSPGEIDQLLCERRSALR